MRHHQLQLVNQLACGSAIMEVLGKLNVIDQINNYFYANQGKHIMVRDLRDLMLSNGVGPASASQHVARLVYEKKVVLIQKGRGSSQRPSVYQAHADITFITESVRSRVGGYKTKLAAPAPATHEGVLMLAGIMRNMAANRLPA